MLILRALLSILFAPIRILFNLFQHKDNLLEWHLTYDKFFVQISAKYKEQNIKDDLLIASYILFLNRYFYICDERQVDIVRNVIRQKVVHDHFNPKELTPQIYNSVLNTLYPGEQKVVGELYINGIPPLTYKDEKDWEPLRANAKYSFLVYERKGKIVDDFHMSFGPDIILLPITVGILYEYVIDKINDKSKRNKLDDAISDLLEAHNQVDCRSLRVFMKLPEEVLFKNDVNYELKE